MGQVPVLRGGGQDAAQGKDPDRLRQATIADNSVVFGGALRLQSLMAAGVARASAVVVNYLDTRSALKVLCNVREHAPGVTKGATGVVPEAIKGSLMLARNAFA